jgi:two-component system response regulator MprA
MRDYMASLKETLRQCRFPWTMEVDSPGGRLLVADDDPDVRDSLLRALRRAGYAVSAASNGSDAIETVARSPVDLIVLDILMPAMDGLAVCRLLRGRGDATPVLALTARDSIDDRVAGLAAGADDYLVKPFALRAQPG